MAATPISIPRIWTVVHLFTPTLRRAIRKQVNDNKRNKKVNSESASHDKTKKGSIWLRAYFKQNRIKEISLKLKMHLTWLDIVVSKWKLKNKIVLDTFMLGDKDFI